MIRNFLKVALRNLLKRKIYSFINIFGLAVALTASLVIFLFVSHELSYDQFHSKSDRIYRFVRKATIGEQQSTYAPINYALADLAIENIPFLEKVTQVAKFNGLVSTTDFSKEFRESRMFMTDPSFFEIFDVEFIAGNQETALSDPFKVVLTESAAERYFGDESPLGKVLTRNRGERDFQVSAVVKDWPKNSHLDFEILASISSSKSWYSDNMFTHWGNVWVYTYGLTVEGVSIETLNGEVNRVAYEHGPEALAALDVLFYSQPLGSIYLESDLSEEIQANGNKLFVQVFTAIGLLILVIASFNFINLATARASWRAKEVGLRKVVGAEKKSLVFQFLGESVLISVISMFIALGLATLVLPQFNEFSGKSLLFSDLITIPAVSLIVLVVLVVGIGAGSLPAFFLSSFQPLQVLKGNSNMGSSKLAENLRKTLVVIQFCISITLVVSSLTIYHQLDFARNKALGYDKENVLVVDLYNKPIRESIEPVKESILNIPGVQAISNVSDTPPSGLNSWWTKGTNESGEFRELTKVLAVDHSFLRTMKIKLLQGRDFDENIITDAESSIIVNESAVKFFNLTDPIGSSIDLQDGMKKTKIIGVVEDFHTASIHEDISPLVITVHPSWARHMLVRIQGSDYPSLIQKVEENWAGINPAWNIRYHFLDEDFNQAYQAEEKLSQLFFSFSSLAILIGVMGLFGLANYVADQKIKEIGIRKVMGANLNQVVWLQYRSFFSALGISFLFAVPVASYLMTQWLDQFAYRVGLNWWLFALAGIITIVVALGTVSVQSVKAGLRNPIDSLRTE